MKGFELLAYLTDLRGSINQEYTNYIAQKLLSNRQFS